MHQVAPRTGPVVGRLSFRRFSGFLAIPFHDWNLGEQPHADGSYNRWTGSHLWIDGFYRGYRTETGWHIYGYGEYLAGFTVEYY